MNRSAEFRRAFAAATVHDFFNFLAVIVIFPLQLLTNFLGIISHFMADIFAGVGGLEFLSPVKEITKPVSKFLLSEIHIFITDPSVYPWIGLVAALLLLFLALKNMVSALKVLVVSKAKALFDRYLFKTDARAFVVGILLTVMVQSSSITTSLMVPMAGAGILTLRQIFPYTLGANIGTTVTAILAALVTGSVEAVTIAFAHLMFNISGIVIWWPLKFVPVKMAEKFAVYATKRKVIPIAYVLVLFFILPLTIIYFSS
jgi:sodium-dependent phosphate cotransporter